MTSLNNRIQMRGISISFPGVKALDNVDFDIESGKIYALIGANGAGKSTLMKVLSGVNNKYEGDIYLNDKKININSTKDALDLGIQTVYQEVDTALMPNLTVAENIYMNTIVNKMTDKQFVNWKTAQKVASDNLKNIGVDIDVRKKVNELSLAEKQMILIAKAVSEDVKFLLLDEPTAPLSKKETEYLFDIIKKLVRDKNVGVVFISHRLSELFEICQEITTMREGKVVKTQSITPDLTVNDIVAQMLGNKNRKLYTKTSPKLGDEVLRIKNLCEVGNKVNNININLRKGEVIGIAGLVGAGKTELCKSIFGYYSTNYDDYILNGKTVNISNPSNAVREGIALIPEERRKEGIFVRDNVYSNLTMPNLTKFLNNFKLVSSKKQLEFSNDVIDKLGIVTPSSKQKVALLSGGNQQKVAIGKWLSTESIVYIFDEPTKGVDIGAKNDIYKLVDELAREQKGVIYASSEFNEILSITDRILVMYDGVIVKELETLKTSEEELLYYSTGGK